MRRDRRRLGAEGLRQSGGAFRRRGHRGVECRRRLAGPHRRSLRRDFAQELRAEFLRASARGAGRDAASCWRKAPAGVCCSTCRNRRSIRVRISAPMDCRRPRRSSSCGNTRSITAPTASAPMRSMPTASAQDCSPTISSRIARKARGLSEKDYMSRQSAWPRSHRRRCCAGLPRAGAGAQDHRGRHHRRRRQYRRRDAVAAYFAGAARRSSGVTLKVRSCPRRSTSTAIARPIRSPLSSRIRSSTPVTGCAVGAHNRCPSVIKPATAGRPIRLDARRSWRRSRSRSRRNAHAGAEPTRSAPRPRYSHAARGHAG